MVPHPLPYRILILFHLLSFLFFHPDSSLGDIKAIVFFDIDNVPHDDIVLPPETVIIDSEEYTVPNSWRGQRIDSPPLTAPPLVQVPPEFVLNGGKIYLLPQARDAFKEMAEAAQEDSVEMVIDSGFRSVRYQKRIYKRLMDKGKSFEEIARFVAPPGYSVHMLGLAVDFVPSNWRFADTPAYQWLKEHGNSYGFYESYPKVSSGNRPWEPSHWQYHPIIYQTKRARKFHEKANHSEN